MDNFIYVSGKYIRHRMSISQMDNTYFYVNYDIVDFVFLLQLYIMFKSLSYSTECSSSTSGSTSGRSKRASLQLRKLKMGIKYDDALYPGLCKLKLNGRNLNNPPPELFTILDLELLDLSPERKSSINYKLQYVPPAISNLINLRVLVLDTNELQVIPVEVTLLVNLERICISNNRLDSLPAGFERLVKMKSLHVANNCFTTIPACVCKLTALEFMDFSDNSITVIPGNIMKLTNLTTLMLVMNRLTEIPDCMCDMTHLRSLWVGGNRIAKLPPNFGRLKYLDWGESHTSSLAVGGNPLVHPPVEICTKGVSAINVYFKRLEAFEGK